MIFFFSNLVCGVKNTPGQMPPEGITSHFIITVVVTMFWTSHPFFLPQMNVNLGGWIKIFGLYI